MRPSHLCNGIPNGCSESDQFSFAYCEGVLGLAIIAYKATLINVLFLHYIFLKHLLSRDIISNNESIGC